VMQSLLSSEARLAREVADRYRDQGYEVIVEPTHEQLPSGLAQYQPNLIARKGDESVVIEVKSRHALKREPWIEDLAKAVRQLPGWRFELVLSGSDLPYALPEGVVPLNEEEARASLDEASGLLRAGHPAPALLMAWSAAEAILRLLAQKEQVDLRRADAAYLLSRLATSAIITRKTYHALRAAMEVRNAVAHGLRPESLSPAQVEDLIELASSLLSEANRGRKS
jgi:hypothetical protein